MIIKNIVFDVGDVLVRFRWRELMQDLNFTEEEIEFLGKNMVQTEYWSQLDEGVHSCDEAPEHFSALYPQYTDQIHRFWDNLVDIVKQFPYADSLIRSPKIRAMGYISYPTTQSKPLKCIGPSSPSWMYWTATLSQPWKN